MSTDGWQRQRLGDLFRIKHGYAFKGEYFSDSGSHVVLTPGNFHDEGGFKLRGSKEKYYTGEIPSSFVLDRGDLLVAMTEQAEGLLGSSALIPESDRYLHNQRLGLIVDLDKSKVDKGFLYHLFNFYGVRDQIRGSASGAKVRHTSPSRIYEVEVSLPPVRVQRDIASVLFAYDDLIENNARRIEILEEIAQAIYREWFVNFRFPGHEQVEMVNSELGPIPEGWNIERLDEVLSALESGKRPKGGIRASDRDVPSIGAENISGLGKYDYSKEKYVSQDFFDSMKRGRIQDRDVLLYKDGAHIGKKSMFRDGYPHAVCCINEHVFILRTNGLCTQSYLYFWLDQPKMTENIKNLNANAAQPGINQAGVKGLPILVPAPEVLYTFDSIAEPLLAELFNLAKKNHVLRRTRDLLLPKLISGEVDVAEADISVEQASVSQSL